MAERGGPDLRIPGFTDPRYSYDHSTGTCAITGGAFYDPAVAQFPAGLRNDYFFADFCGGWIRKLDPTTNTVADFATGIANPVDLKVGVDGALYYLARGIGSVFRVASTTTADSVTPASGSGGSQTFALQYSDSAGVGSLSNLWVWFNATVAATAANSCLSFYETSTQLVYLLNDAGTQWTSGLRGSGSTLQNSQCAIQLASVGLTATANTLTLTLPVIFRAGFAGVKAIFTYASNVNGSASGWQTRGTWTVANAAIVTSDVVTPSSGAGPSQTFALQYSDGPGFDDLATVWVWFNATFAASAANSCLAYYDTATQRINLLNDAGTLWTSGLRGSAGILQNSQCTIQLASTTVAGAAPALTLNLPVVFKSSFAGAKTIFMFAASGGGASSGWQTRGTWAVAGTAIVTADSVTPSSGSGPGQTFALRYSDTAGLSDLAVLWVWFNASFATSSSNSCLAYYDNATDLVYLLNDAATLWMSGYRGSGATLQNSQCSIQLSGTTVTGSGNTLTLTLPVVFKPAFAGPKTIFMYAANVTGTSSGWQTLGTWTAGAIAVTADSTAPNAGSGMTQTFALRYRIRLGSPT